MGGRACTASRCASVLMNSDRILASVNCGHGGSSECVTAGRGPLFIAVRGGSRTILGAKVQRKIPCVRLANSGGVHVKHHSTCTRTAAALAAAATARLHSTKGGSSPAPALVALLHKNNKTTPTCMYPKSQTSSSSSYAITKLSRSDSSSSCGSGGQCGGRGMSRGARTHAHAGGRCSTPTSHCSRRRAPRGSSA